MGIKGQMAYLLVFDGSSYVRGITQGEILLTGIYSRADIISSIIAESVYIYRVRVVVGIFCPGIG